MKLKALASALAILPLSMADAAPAATATTEKKKEKPKISVVMSDGRTVEFPEDTKAQKSFIWAVKEGTGYTDEKDKAADPLSPLGVRWDFSNGQSRTILLSELAPLLATLAAHGLSQKGGDEYSGEKDVDDAQLTFDDLMDRLKKGEWSERRGGGFGGASILAKAISEVFGKSMEEVRAFLRDLNPAEKMAMRQAPELKSTIEKLEAAKAASGKVNVADLLAKAKALQATPAAPAQ